MEHRSDVCTDEDWDFIVGDGYNAEKDSTYVPDEDQSSDDDKNVVTGKGFKKLTKKAKKLGAESLDYLSRKNNKYVATLPDGKKVHFGSPKYPDFLIHQDDARKERYLARAKKIKNRKGEFTWEKPELLEHETSLRGKINFYF